MVEYGSLFADRGQRYVRERMEWPVMPASSCGIRHRRMQHDSWLMAGNLACLVCHL